MHIVKIYIIFIVIILLLIKTADMLYMSPGEILFAIFLGIPIFAIEIPIFIGSKLMGQI